MKMWKKKKKKRKGLEKDEKDENKKLNKLPDELETWNLDHTSEVDDNEFVKCLWKTFDPTISRTKKR